MRHLIQRLLSAGLLTGVLVLGGLAQVRNRVGAAATPAAMSLVAPTKIVIFHPRGTKGAPVAGDCGMGESQALDRSDAWRCIVGNVIYDPCFSTSPHATWVICAVEPGKPIGIKVTLSKPLPTHAPAKDQQPWFITLGDGTGCGFVSGATFGFGGQRANYGCTQNDWLIGLPTTGKVWWAVEARMTGKFGPNGPIAAHIWGVSVASVVL
ncbi:MAG TPA: hypothetical protein VNL71_25540 [Chloroflexota bacterium]|nr:hypothetical protein [Chloroflexota bacterium]